MNQLKFSQNTIQGTIWGSLNKCIAVFVPFIIRTIIIKKLGFEYAGLSSLFTSVLQILSLTELGFSSAMVFEMYKPVADNDYKQLSALLRYYKNVYLVIGSVMVAVGIALMPVLKWLISGDVPKDVNIYIIYALYLLNTAISYLLFAYRSAILNAYQREADNAKIQLISNSLMYAVQIVVLILYANYYLYIIFLPAFTILNNYIRYLYVEKKYPLITCVGVIKDSKKENIKKNISALLFHKVGNVTVNALDNIVISAFLGLVLLAHYNNYYYVINAVTSFVLIFFNSIAAGIGNRLLVNGKKQNLNDFYKILYINGFIVVVCTSCLFGMFQDFITIWVGKENRFPFTTMVLFCIYFFIHTIRRTIIVYRDAAGMWVDNKWQPIVSAFINLLLNVILIQIIGLNGVLLSTIISMVVVDIPWESGKLLRALFVERELVYYRKLLLFAILAVVSCLVIYPITATIKTNSVICDLIFDGMVSVSVPIMVFIGLTFYSDEMKDVVATIFKHIGCC